MTVFTNIGFMGVPMIDGIYGKGALIYMTVFLIPFNILFYSYAIQTIHPDTSARRRFNLKDLCNIGMLSCLLAIVIYFSGIKIPYVLATTIHMIGALTAPLAMMLIGSSLPDISFRELFTDRRLILFTALKMVIFPAAILIVMKPFIQNEILLAVCMAAMATPSGNMLAMLAALYNKDAFLTATKGISLTTAAAVITMPLVALLAGIGH